MVGSQNHRRTAVAQACLRHAQKSIAIAGVLIAGVALTTGTAEARLTKFQVTELQSPTFGGYSWPGVGQYEKIVGTAYGELDPSNPQNAVIADIGRAPRNANGMVEYSYSFYILRPIDLTKGAHKVMYEPPNRGNKTWNTFGRVPSGNDPGGTITDPTTLANAFLMPRGYSMVWSGWDKAAGTNPANYNSIINLPVATNPDGSTITGPAFEYIVTSASTYTLNYPTATLDKTQMTLTHRVHLDDQPVVVPPDQWNLDPTGTILSLTSGPFVSNDIYEFSYTAKSPTVNGVGFAAVRDFNEWLRYGTVDDDGNANPMAGDIQRIYTEVVSQPARLLNDFTHLGFNQGEGGKKIFDGMMQWIGAGDGINLNFRWSQPGRTERNRQDHLFAEGVFPFANVRTTDPITGKTDSRYNDCTMTNTCPLAAEIYSANEYWVKAASLLHTTPDGKRDLPDSPYARNYFISSHQHGVGSATSKGACQQFQNPLDSQAVQRALWIALDAWSTVGTPPPPSQVPRLSDHTMTDPSQTSVGFPNIPGVTYTGLKTTRYLLDYGSTYYMNGIPTINPPLITPPYENNPSNGPIYPSYVPVTDSDGNDIPGIHLPDVSVPLATYTGWALRSGVWANDGCEGSGQYIPFAATAAARQASGDPRPSVQERYPTFATYHRALVKSVDNLVTRRLMLCEDVESQMTRLINAGLAAGVPAPANGEPPRTTVPACKATGS
ncbi:MAG: hypothetical protein JSR59_11545 [Proteobacteria bacterium]|nr:hypothetical protein [Pseudomonadota bacterium]